MSGSGGWGVFPSVRLAPAEMPGPGGQPLAGEDCLQGEVIRVPRAGPRGPSSGSVVGGGTPSHRLDACIRLASVLSRLVLCLEVRSHL